MLCSIAVLRKSDHGRDSPELAPFRAVFPSKGCEVKILDEADQEVAVGEPGEICVRSPYAMAEYWKRPEQTALDAAQWLASTLTISRAPTSAATCSFWIERRT